MKFTIEKNKLVKLLTNLNSIMNSDNKKNENILITATDKVIIKSANSSVTVISNLDTNIKETGEVNISGLALFSMVRAMPEGDIDFSLKGKELNIKKGRINYKLGIDEEYNIQEIPNDEMKSFFIKSSELKEIAFKSTYSVSVDELRQVLTAVLFDFNETGLSVVSTDSAMLSKVVKDIKIDPIQLLLPVQTLDMISNFLTKEEEIKISYAENFIKIEMEDLTLYSRLINGKYPAYQAIIPTNCDKSVIVNRKELVNALTRINIVSNPLTRALKLSFNDNELTIESEDTTSAKRGSEAIDYVGEIESFIVGLNATKFSAILKHLTSDNIRIEFNDNSKPLLIKEEKAKNDLNLIMPIKLSKE